MRNLDERNYADDLILMGENMDELRENFDQWKEHLKVKGWRSTLERRSWW